MNNYHVFYNVSTYVFYHKNLSNFIQDHFLVLSPCTTLNLYYNVGNIYMEHIQRWCDNNEDDMNCILIACDRKHMLSCRKAFAWWLYVASSFYKWENGSEYNVRLDGNKFCLQRNRKFRWQVLDFGGWRWFCPHTRQNVLKHETTWKYY